MIAFLLNHIWQSSLCVGLAWLIALGLRQNSANIRFWVWFAASLKFLVPFAAITALSSYALAPMVPPITLPTVRAAEPIAKPFFVPINVQVAGGLIASATSPAHPMVRPAPTHSAPSLPPFRPNLESVLLAIWAVGFLVLQFDGFGVG